MAMNANVLKNKRWSRRLGHNEQQRNLETRPQVPIGRMMNAEVGLGWEKNGAGNENANLNSMIWTVPLRKASYLKIISGFVSAYDFYSQVG